MGLAASQARFLAITARRADCEFKSLQLAQQKMSIGRELSNASSEYENALNATKLVWDASGGGDNLLGTVSNTVTNLDYNVLMTPSVYNAYNPYVLTNPHGEIILTDKYAQAARLISPNGAPVQPSADGYLTFVNALYDNGVIAPTTYSSMGSKILVYTPDGVGASPSTALPEDNIFNNYNPIAGMGGQIYDKTENLGVTIGGLIDALSAQEFDSYDNTGTAQYKNIYSVKDVLQGLSNVKKYMTTNASGSDTVWSDLSLGEILGGQYSIKFNTDSANVALDFTKKFIKKVASLLGLQFSDDGNLIGVNSADPNNMAGLYTDKASYKALEIACRNTIDKFTSTITLHNTERASEYNEVFRDKNDADGDVYEVPLTNIVRSFLTYFAHALSKGMDGYSVAGSVVGSKMVTSDTGYYYILANSQSITDNEALLYNDFYSQLYNQICANGWVDNSTYNIDNNEYLENELKNGQIFVSSLNADGYFYQSAYSDTEYIVAVKDNDAIARAEAKYNGIKSKLDNKEEDLDLQIKTLDLEIAALNTEYDTVKNLINKNIDKTFNMFSSG